MLMPLDWKLHIERLCSSPSPSFHTGDEAQREEAGDYDCFHPGPKAEMNFPEPLKFRAEKAVKVELNEDSLPFELMPSVFHMFLLDKGRSTTDWL